MMKVSLSHFQVALTPFGWLVNLSVLMSFSLKSERLKAVQHHQIIVSGSEMKVSFFPSHADRWRKDDVQTAEFGHLGQALGERGGGVQAGEGLVEVLLGK